MISFLCGNPPPKKRTNKMKHEETPRYREQIYGCQIWAGVGDRMGKKCEGN